MKFVAIILARGGSKGIPRKNIIQFCGKPLLAWSIEQCIAGGIKDVYISSDSEEILSIGREYGAIGIKRPDIISSDESSSEMGLIHSLDYIEKETGPVDWVLAPQVTSPIRESKDISKIIKLTQNSDFDSLLSVVKIEDFFIWKEIQDLSYKSINYDYKNRLRRQDIEKTYHENGSIYLFKPKILRSSKNRLGGEISIYQMERHKMFQIDNFEDLKMCEIIMKAYGYS
jgi:CMP-N,N'-diacetyllegionaminic acid synthase